MKRNRSTATPPRPLSSWRAIRFVQAPILRGMKRKTRNPISFRATPVPLTCNESRIWKVSHVLSVNRRVGGDQFMVLRRVRDAIRHSRRTLSRNGLMGLNWGKRQHADERQGNLDGMMAKSQRPQLRRLLYQRITPRYHRAVMSGVETVVNSDGEWGREATARARYRDPPPGLVSPAGTSRGDLSALAPISRLDQVPWRIRQWVRLDLRVECHNRAGNFAPTAAR